jgi:hypothetical protein
MMSAGIRDRDPHVLTWAAFCTSILGLTFAFAAAGIPRWMPASMIVRLGIPSPLTGMTRSFVAMVHGDLAGSFGWHPLGPLAFVAVVSVASTGWWSWARGGWPAWARRLFGGRRFWAGTGSAFAVAWLHAIVVGT